MAAGAFVVYMHCRPDGTPFYVGKGRYTRAMRVADRNPFHQYIVNKYGASKILRFAFECESEEQALSDEKLHIADLRAQGYQLANLTDGGEGTTGHKHTEEARAKIAEANLGNKRTLGRKLTQQHKDQIAFANRSRQYPVGMKLSESHKAAISAANIGNKYSLGRRHTDEARAKVSAALKGNKRSLGKIVSEETKRRLSEAAKADWAKRKATNQLQGA